MRLADCHLPEHGWGMLTLTRAAPRTATAWISDGSSHEQRGLPPAPCPCRDPATQARREREAPLVMPSSR